MPNDADLDNTIILLCSRHANAWCAAHPRWRAIYCHRLTAGEHRPVCMDCYKQAIARGATHADW